MGREQRSLELLRQVFYERSSTDHYRDKAPQPVTLLSPLEPHRRFDLRAEGSRSRPRTSARRSASKLSRFAGRMGAKGFIGVRAEFPRFCVSLNLAIPRSRIVFREPLPKLCEFLRRETGYSLLEGFELTHRRNNTTISFRGLRRCRQIPVAARKIAQLDSVSVRAAPPIRLAGRRSAGPPGRSARVSRSRRSFAIPSRAGG